MYAVTSAGASTAASNGEYTGLGVAGCFAPVADCCAFGLIASGPSTREMIADCCDNMPLVYVGESATATAFTAPARMMSNGDIMVVVRPSEAEAARPA